MTLAYNSVDLTHGDCQQGVIPGPSVSRTGGKVCRMRFLVAFLSIFTVMPIADAAPGGLHVSSTNNTPIPIGTSLTVTSVVKNSGTTTWLSTPYSWVHRLANLSWTPTNGLSTSDHFNYGSVVPGASVTGVAFITAASMPTSPGSYHVDVIGYYPTDTSGNYYIMSGSPRTVYFTIVVSSNAAPTNIVISRTSVAENLSIGTKVGSFSTQDRDAGNTFVYALTNGTGGTDNGSFTISGSNLLTAASFNCEVKSNYSIRVQSKDQGGLFTQKVFAISVTDVDETPSFNGLATPAGGNMIIRWSSVTNHTYTIFCSTNLLAGFSVLQSNIPATPVVNSYTDSVLAVGRKFWKITTNP